MRGSRHNPFAPLHPAVAFTYLVVGAGFAMAAAHPVYAALALAGATACSCCTRGWRATARQLPWLLGAIAVVTVANLLFVHEGESVLVRVGGTPLTCEALAYGLSSGAMLAAVLLWFQSYAACIDSAAAMELIGRFAPACSLAISQVMRLVPQFAGRGRTVLQTAAATSAAAPRTRRERTRDRLRTVSVLMGWGLEDSIVRADAMRARGYASGIRRTVYRRQRLTRTDIALIALVVLLAGINAPLMGIACAQFSFYPTMPALIAWWGYLPYLAFLAVAPALYVREWLLWRR